MRILLTGANGQLGRCFQDRLPTNWEIRATDASELDITDKKSVEEYIASYLPDAIVNAAAYTFVDKAESEIDLAKRVNINGPKNLALAAAQNNAKLIHISTDYVFDGNKTAPYHENDATNPLNIYGTTKLLGEQKAMKILPQTVILRTSWVFSEYGNNFVKTILKLAKKKDTLKIVNDQLGCPTYAGDIAQAIIDILEKSNVHGIYHYCGDTKTTWQNFAEAITSLLIDKNLISKVAQITGIPTEDYPTPAKRPKYSCMDCTKIAHLGISPSDWNSRLAEVVERLNNK